MAIGLAAVGGQAQHTDACKGLAAMTLEISIYMTQWNKLKADPTEDICYAVMCSQLAEFKKETAENQSIKAPK